MQQSEDSSTPQSLGLLYEHKPEISWKSWSINLLLKATFIKKWLPWDSRLSGKISEKNGDPEPPKGMRNRLNVTSWKVNGRNVFRIEPKQNKTDTEIIFLHGGAYIFNTSNYHWALVERLIKDNNCSVLALDYPLAPENSYLECHDYVEAVYKEVIATKDPKNMILLGDSAGGGLALAFAQKIKLGGTLPQPAHIILLSPWLDLVLDHPETIALDSYDDLLSRRSLKKAGLVYARDKDPTDYLLSPINGPVEGLGKISLFISTHELFYADAKRFKTKCNSQGVPIDLYTYPRMVHDWCIFNSAESEQVYKQLQDIINK